MSDPHDEGQPQTDDLLLYGMEEAEARLDAGVVNKREDHSNDDSEQYRLRETA